MWRWEDVKMICVDVKMRRCEDKKMICGDVKKRGCEGKRLTCVDVKMWRCENVSQTQPIPRTLRSDALGKKHTWFYLEERFWLCSSMAVLPLLCSSGWGHPQNKFIVQEWLHLVSAIRLRSQWDMLLRCSSMVSKNENRKHASWVEQGWESWIAGP